MPHIAQLSSRVADLIAAGEVVERPASVVKELVENAVDAGATAVTVEIQHGGMTLIRVTDDGCGIAPGEVETAFLRHATSKLRTECDLEAIGTLGFRGEALAAIASVSRVELLTRRREDPLGTSLTLEGGVPEGKEEAGCPSGSTFIVRNLFYNTPARFKFMKKDSAEGAACLAALQRQALAHPEISFKFLRDGRQDLLTPGDGQLKSALYAVLGRDFALGFQAVEASQEDISVSGFISMPSCCRGTRGYQFFFVNGRYIKSKMLAAAVEQAYANQKMVGKFPGCVLHLNVKRNAVDVNVHPTKEEVKFSQERAVFSAVYSAAMVALDAGYVRPQADAGAFQAVVPVDQAPLPLHAPPAPRFTRPEDAAPPKAPPDVSQRDAAPLRHSPPERPYAAPPAHTNPRLKEEKPRFCPSEPVCPSGNLVPPPNPCSNGEAPEPRAPPEPLPPADTGPCEDVAGTLPWRVAGELFHTYIVVEQGEKALLIDKHAAHERMNFDRMRAQDYQPMSQELLLPVVFAPAPEEAQALLEHLDELDRLGFEAEDFGNGSLAVRRAPDYVDPGDIPATLTEIAGKLIAFGSASDSSRRDGLLHTMACKAAIKGGWKNALEELERIAQAVMSGQVKYCPHGRPVAIELSKRQLEKQFKRT